MEPKYIFSFVAISIVILLILFAIWQEMAKRNLDQERLNPKDYSPFKNFPFEFWYVGIREAPSLKKMFTSVYDRLGRTNIHDSNRKIIGHIGIKTVYESRCIVGESSISSTPDIQEFTNFLRSIAFKDDRTGAEVFTFEPIKKGIQYILDWEFTVAQKKYRLLARPMFESFDDIVEIYEGKELVGRIARTSARQFPMAVLNREIDPLALVVTFDLFGRHLS